MQEPCGKPSRTWFFFSEFLGEAASASRDEALDRASLTGVYLPGRHGPGWAMASMGQTTVS